MHNSSPGVILEWLFFMRARARYNKKRKKYEAARCSLLALADYNGQIAPSTIFLINTAETIAEAKLDGYDYCLN